MKVFWLFRSNLRQYEYYHSIDSLEQFKKQCHDFYLLMGIWMLENTELEEFVVWRLMPQPTDRTVHSSRTEFEVNGKSFIQLFVNDFTDCFNFTQFPKPDITLFRGGFPEYAEITKTNPDFFGLKLYLGAGRRIQPQYGGIYDKILMEDLRDIDPETKKAWNNPKYNRDIGALLCNTNIDKHGNKILFYKTANPNIFYPMDLEKKWDICWPCNFAQMKYKGQEWFIEQVSGSNYLKSLKIVHLGNKPGEGIKLCQKHGVYNIDFKGWVTRPELNKYLNMSKQAIVTSNMDDGSPRIITEIHMTGTPVLIRNTTKRTNNLITRTFNDFISIELWKNNLEELEGLRDLYIDFRNGNSHIKFGIGITMDAVCQKNLELWR